MLIQLPTGDWIDPREVVAIHKSHEGGAHKATLKLQDNDWIRWTRESEAEAVELRDAIARAVNQSLREEGK